MRLNGIALAHRKGTENSETIAVPCPETVRIAMSQHMGAPCMPLVKAGDEVSVGQKIGDCEAFYDLSGTFQRFRKGHGGKRYDTCQRKILQGR